VAAPLDLSLVVVAAGFLEVDARLDGPAVVKVVLEARLLGISANRVLFSVPS